MTEPAEATRAPRRSRRAVALVSLGVVAAMVAGVTAFLVLRDDGRAEAAEQPQDVNLLELQAGDCLPDFPNRTEPIDSLPVLPCTASHRAEVFAVFLTKVDPSMSQTQITAQVQAECMRLFEGYVGRSYPESMLDVESIIPWADSAPEDAFAWCIARNQTQDMTASVEGSRL